LAQVFKLTDEEQKRLANFPVGQGLFFAGQNHVHIQIQASDTEYNLINTNPVSKQIKPSDLPIGGYGAV
jgi:type IV secretory pathway virB4 components-like protein (fragment)